MERLAIQLDVPEGWTLDDSNPEMFVCRPDDGPGALIISRPEFSFLLWDMEAPEIHEVFVKFLGTKLDEVLGAAAVTHAYAPTLRAECEHAGFEEATAWLVVPGEDLPLRETLLVTWLAEYAVYGDTAHEIVASIRPSRPAALVERGVERAERGQAPIAMFLDRNGASSELDLATVVVALHDYSIRDACARRRATMVVVVTLFGAANEYATVYVESRSAAWDINVIRGDNNVTRRTCEPRGLLG